MRVIDASVAVSLVILEVHTGTARSLVRDAANTGEQLAAPPHFRGEVINGIYQKVRSTDPTKHIDEIEARLAITSFLRLQIDVLSPAGLYERAFDLARAYGLPSIYDGLYVALADLVGGDLWTADRRLLQALGGQLANVRWLGDYQAGDAGV